MTMANLQKLNPTQQELYNYLEQQTGHQTHRTGSQRDERVDGIAGQGAADQISHRSHGEAARRAEPDRRQVGGQRAQIEPQKAGGNGQHAGKDDAHSRQKGQHRQGTDR